MKFAIYLLICFLSLQACTPANRLQPVTLVVGSWYGFYPFYFAAKHKLDEKHGLRLKILEPTNIANLRRAYLREQVDFVATSMIEFTNAISISQSELEPLIITDYSNGGDVVVATKTIANIDALRGARIAVPSNGIGEYVLSLIFGTDSLTDAFIQVPIPESECENAFAAAQIDACVTYPPLSTYMLRNDDLHTLYSSKTHPKRIFDLVWGKPNLSETTRQAMRAMWFETISLIERDPIAFHHYLAEISSVSVASVEESMAGIELINKKGFALLLNEQLSLASDLITVCRIAENQNCEQFGSAFEHLEH